MICISLSLVGMRGRDVVHGELRRRSYRIMYGLAVLVGRHVRV
jgi:hypothetical protein